MSTTKLRRSLAPGETRAYPVLPLRDIVVFPHMVAALLLEVLGRLTTPEHMS
jgi:ATP-dependent Lon protease